MIRHDHLVLKPSQPKLVALTALALVATMTGCVEHRTDTALHTAAGLKPSTTSPKASTGSPSASPSASSSKPATGEAAQLLDKMIPLPPGAKVWPHTPTGDVDLTDLVNTFYKADARQREKALASQRRFVTAAHRGWFNADGSQSVVFLVRFRGSAGAESMYADLIETWKEAPSEGTVFTLSAVHGKGLIRRKLDDLGNASVTIAATRGDIFVRVVHWTAGYPDKGVAELLMGQQFDSLES